MLCVGGLCFLLWICFVIDRFSLLLDARVSEIRGTGLAGWLLCVFVEFLRVFACRARMCACAGGRCCAQNALCLQLQVRPAHKNFSLGIHFSLEMPEMPVAVRLHKTNPQMCTRYVRACFAFPAPRAASNRKWYAFEDCAWLISGGARVFADVYLEDAPVF